MITVAAEPLTAAAFAPFGDVIAAGGGDYIEINEGMARRYHDLADVDVAAEGGRALISVFSARPWFRPIRLRVMERHPLGSQAFVPMHDRPFLVVVAPPGPAPLPAALRAFVTDGAQGVNYARGVWHHPLLALDRIEQFLVVDRGGEGHNLDEIDYHPHNVAVVLPGDRAGFIASGARGGFT